MEKMKGRQNVKTEKRNKIFIEEINPKELTDIWNKLKELNESF